MAGALASTSFVDEITTTKNWGGTEKTEYFGVGKTSRPDLTIKITDIFSGRPDSRLAPVLEFLFSPI